MHISRGQIITLEIMDATVLGWWLVLIGSSQTDTLDITEKNIYKDSTIPVTPHIFNKWRHGVIFHANFHSGGCSQDRRMSYMIIWSVLRRNL